MSELDTTFRPIVVCLCGSTKFKTQFAEATERETLAGRIVLSVGFFAHAMTDEERRAKFTPAVKKMLDELHLGKINLADEVLILNVGGYVGASTKRELWYAWSQDKRIRWLEDKHRILTGDIGLLFDGWEAWRRAGDAAAVLA